MKKKIMEEIIKMFEKYQKFSQHEQANGSYIRDGLVKELTKYKVDNKIIKEIEELSENLNGPFWNNYINRLKNKIL